MPNKHLPMKLSREEENFLRHWIFDESHYQDGPGPAKRLQLEHQVAPVQLATIIAAAMPNLEVQAAAAKGPPPGSPPIWPWARQTFDARLAEAQAVLEAAGVPSSH